MKFVNAKVRFVKCFISIFAGLMAAITASAAQAYELDTLFPDTIPGYGIPFGVTNYSRLRRMDSVSGFNVDGLDLNPALTLGTGYDSAPNGNADGSFLMQETPRIEVSDAEIGLGALIAGVFQQYPKSSTQNLAGVTMALGDQIILPRETITLSAAYIKSQETSFALNTLALNQPVAFMVCDFRISDKISTGMFEITPDISLTNYRFDQFAGQNRSDIREGVTAIYDAGGPGSLVLRVHATQSHYVQTVFNAGTYEALAGMEYDVQGLWNIRLLAGMAQRHGNSGASVTAPVIEASIDWMPSDLDRVSIRLAREIDDPDSISAQPYTLTMAKLSLAHEYLRNITVNVSAEIDNAAYFSGNLKETTISTNAVFEWHLNQNIAMDTNYSFNDRQANYIPAEDEHVVTVSVVWTP